MSNTNETSLVPVDPWRGILEQAYDGDGFLSEHFRNGLEEFAVDENTLAAQRTKLEESRQKDIEIHERVIAKEKSDFNERHGLLARVTRRATFTEPALEPSLETTIYEKAVEVGQTLTEYLANLRKFASQFSVLGERYQRLCEQETELELRKEQLDRRASTYEEEKRLTADLLAMVMDYSALADTEQDALTQSISEATDGIDINDENVRETFIRQLRKGQFVLDQTHTADAAEYEAIDIQLDYVSESLEGIQKRTGWLWSLYNPARVEAVRLGVTYRELSSSAETDLGVLNVSKVLISARELCESARERQDALEAAVEGQLEVLSAFREVNDERGFYQLSAENPTGDDE